MKTFELNGYTIAVPEIPEGAMEVELHKTNPPILDYLKDAFSFSVGESELPEGNWQLYQLESVPEELAGGMVDRTTWHFPEKHTVYRDYQKPITGKNEVTGGWRQGWNIGFNNAKASLTSFLRSHGIEGNVHLLIKKNNEIERHCEECGKPESDQCLVPSHGGVNELWCLDCMRLSGRCVSCATDIRLVVENYSDYENDECPKCLSTNNQLTPHSADGGIKNYTNE